MPWRQKAGKEEGRNTEFRRILGNGYTFVLGQQYTMTASALTYEELAKQQIKRITEVWADGRPSELQRIEKIEQELVRTVEQIKSLPPESFLQKNPDEDVNTEK